MKKYQYLASWDDQTLTRVGEPVVVLGDSNVSQVEVTLPSNFLLDPTKAECRMYFLLPGEKESDHDVLEAATKDENGDSHVTWTIKHVHSQKGGRLAFSLTLIGDDAQWDSRTAIIPVYESRYQPESEEAEEPYTGRLDALEGSMAAIRGEFAEVQDDFEELKETATLGAPIPKSLASEMVEGGVYLYTGTEPGYTAGHVYYYVGGALTDGGVYGGTAVDATLTQSGKAADAKVTGDKIAEIKEDLSYIGAYPLTWEQGRFNMSGNEITGEGRIRTIDHTPVTAGETFVVSVPDSTMVYFYAWNMDGSFNGYTSLALTNGDTYTVPDGVDKIKLVAVANRDFPKITPDYGTNVAIYRTDSALIKTLSNPLKGYSRAMLTIIDDDCNTRFYTDLYPIIKEKNVPVSTAVITGSVGDGTHMTWEQIQECYVNGIEVLSHTNKHPLSTDSDFDAITTDEIAKDYLIAKNQLALHGVPSDILVFSGSTGLHDKFRQACARVYKAGVLAGDNVTNYQGTDPYAIKRYRIGNDTSYACDLAVLKGLINKLNKYGGWMVWMMHTSGGANQWTPGTGEGSSAYIVGQAIDYAVSLGIPIVTAEYGVRKYFDA